MRKIFTSALAAMFALGVYADDVVTKLDKTKVIYMTNDTITTAMTVEEDPDTGEEIEVMGDKLWMGANCVDAFNACGMPLGGTSSTKHQFKFTTRNNYVDPVTGFTMDAGAYRGVFIDGTISLTGNLGGNAVKGYSNCKAMVLYFFPIPTTWVSGGISVQDYPTGRVQAKYLENIDGTITQTSAQIYRELHMNMQDDINDDTHVIKKTDVLNFERNAENPLEITVDQPYKLTVYLDNRINGEDLEGQWESDTKRGELANVIMQPGSTEAEMSYFFAKTGTCYPYSAAETSGSPFQKDADGNDTNLYKTDAASGYDFYGMKWGEKCPWTPETIIDLAVKKRMYLVGMALVSATDGAASEFMNAADGLNAKWSDSAKAYCAHPADPSGIQIVEVAAKANNAVYNLAGQRVNANAKGIVVMNGKKFLNK